MIVSSQFSINPMSSHLNLRQFAIDRLQREFRTFRFWIRIPWLIIIHFIINWKLVLSAFWTLKRRAVHRGEIITWESGLLVTVRRCRQIRTPRGREVHPRNGPLISRKDVVLEVVDATMLRGWVTIVHPVWSDEAGKLTRLVLLPQLQKHRHGAEGYSNVPWSSE